MGVSRRVLWILLPVILVGHGAAFWFLATGVEFGEAGSDVEAHAAGVFFASESMFQQDAVAQDISELFDTAPLFLPTRYNYTTQALQVDVEQADGAGFQAYESLLVEGSEAQPDFLGNLGRGDVWLDWTAPQWPRGGTPLPQVSERSPAFHVKVLAGDGEVVGMRVGSVDEAIESAFQESWRPVVIAAAYDELGPVGFPRLIESSGSSEVDQWLVERVDRTAADWLPRAGGWLRFVVSPWIGSDI
ncbi:MAG: hypothetical protein ACPGN3_02735 [Opitutales bacterium]